MVDSSGAEFLESGGVPLGVDKDAEYEERNAKLPEGATLVLYSDGWTEAPRIGGGRVGDQDWIRRVQESARESDARSALNAVSRKFFPDITMPPDDDLAGIFIRRCI